MGQTEVEFYQTPVLGLGLGVDFTFAWNNQNSPHLNFVKGTLLGDKEQEIRDKKVKGLKCHV